MTCLNERIEDRYSDYFIWLCETVCVDGRYSDETYWTLAEILWGTEFTYILDMDADREADGVALRRRYRSCGGSDIYTGPCTVLEVLVALAGRMYDILDELDGEDKTPMLFWLMIDNLGLSNYSDTAFSDYPDRAGLFERRIRKRLHAWLYRHINYNGEGGLFPLRNPRYDQRDIDIWYQANAYMIENNL